LTFNKLRYSLTSPPLYERIKNYELKIKNEERRGKRKLKIIDCILFPLSHLFFFNF